MIRNILKTNDYFQYILSQPKHFHKVCGIRYFVFWKQREKGLIPLIYYYNMYRGN